MAKTSKSRSVNVSKSSLAPLLRTTKITKPFLTPVTQNILAQLDRRQFKPDISVRAPGPVKRSQARLTVGGGHKVRGQVSPSSLSHRVGFAVPNKIAICVRRKQRKEIMHALKHSGKRGGQGKHRRNIWSDVTC